ncbi:MAG TPA: sugar phosphate isomerase/epimerase family protein [Methanocella sp.]|nr:sugar phosphate isomerase/epimerase family protein [Methanocella sp.]
MYLGTLADPREVEVKDEVFYAREKGFDFVELSLEGPRTSLDQLAPRAKELIQLREELGIFYTCHTPWGWNVGNPYRKIREATIVQVGDVIEFAEQVEARLVTVHMHTRFGLYDRKELIRTMAEGMTALCDRAATSGMAVTVENVDQGPEDMRRLFELEPRAKFHLDVGHANLMCSGGAHIYEFIRDFRDRLYHVHVHDNRGGNDVHSDLHLPLGSGNIDWPRVVKALKEAGYNRTVTFEVFGKNRQYLEYSKDLFKDLLGSV